MKINPGMALVLLATFAGCGGGGGSVGPPLGGGGPSASPSPSPSPTPTPTPALHAYVSAPLSEGPGLVYIYPLPLNSGTLRDAQVLAGHDEGVALDSMDRLFVARNAGSVPVFTQPIANLASPSFTLAEQANTTDITFDASGDAFVVRSELVSAGVEEYQGFIDSFTAPVTSSSVVSFTIGGSSGVPAELRAAGFDRSGDLWVTALPSSSSPGEIFEFTPPLGAQSVPALTIQTDQAGPGIAFDSVGNMYVAGQNGVDVYTPPFTASTVKAFTVPVTGSVADYIAFDPSGNLYVTTGESVLVFTPPFSAASMPAVTLSGRAVGIAIGP